MTLSVKALIARIDQIKMSRLLQKKSNIYI